jgi:putative addiction module component (TIGR02574 family)
MVDPALQSVIEAMSLDERMELVEFIENSVDQSAIELAGDHKAMIESRAGELDADPSLGLTWSKLDARLGSRWA